MKLRAWRKAFIFFFIFISAIGLASAASAQTQTQAPQTGKLLVTVVDQLGGVIPNAPVTVTSIEDATKAATLTPIKTTDKGVATFENLPLGRYSIAAEFGGFDPNSLKDIRIKAGDNKHVIVLALKKMSNSVEVTRDKQEANSDRGVLFGSALTREQIEALSDDPAEMRRQLLEMAGGDATIRVDSFEGQELPQKAQIKSIHITRDQFAAESHTAGGTFIDIITQPGIGPIRTSFFGGFHNNQMEARNPFAPAKGPAQNYNYSGNIGGSLIKDRAQFSLGANQFAGYSTPNLYAATAAGVTQSENLNLRTSDNSFGLSGTLDYALTKDQTLRISMNGSRSNFANAGVGNYDRLERAFSSESRGFSIRATEAGPFGRRFFLNTRFSLNWNDSATHSVSEAVINRVLDSFTEGGAQQKGGTHSRTFTFATDLDYVRGKHSWRSGVQLDGTRYRSDAVSNFNGTYVFESLAAYNAGTPRSFTRRVGDPNIEYWHLQFGWYLQDDIRLRKNLSLSPGVRMEVQTHLKDYVNISPRFGATWSPFKSGRTSVRGSWGIFYEWLPAGTYVNTIQNDGFHLLEVNMSNPTFPDPGVLPGAAPVNRYQYGDTLAMARNMRTSASVNQSIGRRFSLSSTYAETRGYNLLVGSNLNAPVLGVRPNAQFVNVFATNSLGSSRGRTLSSNLSVSLGRLPAAGTPVAPTSTVPLFDWRRGLGISGGYYIAKSANNTDGAFAVPATGNLALEWGPSLGDVRHNVNASFRTSMFKNVSFSLSGNWSSAPPINIRTGTDDNGDLIFNDRPANVGRNSARTVSQWNTRMSVSYSFGFGKSAPVALPPGIVMIAPGGIAMPAAMSSMGAMPSAPRYRMGISFSIANLTNHFNPGGFSGVMTSPFFLKPTTMGGSPRNAQVSFNLSF